MSDIRQNLVLARLRPAEWEAVQSHLQSIDLEAGRVLFAAGARMDCVYFPIGCVVSLVVGLPEGREIECGAIGYEGIVGTGGALAGEESFSQQRVQASGAALVMPRKAFVDAQASCAPFAAAVSAYHDAFVAQLLQTAACLAAHPAQDRLARWLLEMDDRVQGRPLALTHEALASMTGVSRPTVTLLMRSFESSGILKSARKQITVVDRRGLEAAACSCYVATRDVYQRVGLRPVSART